MSLTIIILGIMVVMLAVALVLMRGQRDYHKAVADARRKELVATGAELLNVRRQLEAMRGKKEKNYIW